MSSVLRLNYRQGVNNICTPDTYVTKYSFVNIIGRSRSNSWIFYGFIPTFLILYLFIPL